MVIDLLDLERYLGKSALFAGKKIITYKDLLQEEERIADMIGQRSLLFLLCSNTSASIAGYLACLNHAIVPVMLDSSLDFELMQNLICIYRPEYLWMPEKKADDYPFYDEILHMDGYVLLATSEENPFSLHDNLALLMTTSGSTGSPKLVRLSYENILANTKSIIDYLDMDSRERGITNLPMHYVYGLSIINTHLLAGGSLVVTDKSLFQKEFWQLVREHEVTNLGGVPYTYEMLNRLRFFRMDLPALRTLTQAGGKLDPELHRKFAEYAEQQGKKFVVMYGAAEATARMGWLPTEDSLRKCGSMGQAIPGGRFELVYEDGRVITETNQIGELVYYGPNVSMGYALSGEDLCKGDERQGRLATGDLARVDADGIYTIVGRKKRFLKIFGKRTNLQEVEHILRQKFGITELACAGQDDKMYVFLSEKQHEDEVIPYLSEKLGLHSSAFAVRIIAEIPKNAAGKTIYRELEQYYDC